MNRWLFLIVFSFVQISSFAQLISGKVTDVNGNGLIGTSVYVLGTYDGTITDTLGLFKFRTSVVGEKVLVVKYVGYEDSETPVTLVANKPLIVNIKIKEKNTELNEVVITAGVFEAGDKKRGLQLKSLDILTTANSNGDIANALNTLPGTQSVGEEGGIFVRGGEKTETKTFVDGMLVSNPYSSKVPDVPSRGRFSPMLFSGVSFSTGGYSAEYGQALSSALILQTPALPEKNLTSCFLSPFGANVTRTWRRDSTSLTAIFGYNNMAAYYKVIKQNVVWKKSPESVSSTLLFKRKIGKTGFLKTFGSFSSSRLGMVLPEVEVENDNRNLKLNNQDVYLNTVYTALLPAQWSLKAGGSYNYDAELVDFDHLSANTYNNTAQGRFTLQKNLREQFLFKIGVEGDFQRYHQDYVQKDSAFKANMHYNSGIAAAFMECEWSITRKLFMRFGTRMEYTSLQHESALAPRMALAYKTSENSQVSFAYGTFTQLPKDDYMKFNASLTAERAAHYIANYQYSKDDRMFRAEAFYKKYNHLVTYDSIINDPNPLHYHSVGYGYARGIEFFLRDKKTLKNGDFWVSYTFLDTKKKYQDIQSLQQPYLFSKHSLSVVGKYFVLPINTQFGLTYQYTSGRPYYQPLGPGFFQQHYTQDNHNVSMNLSYLTHIGGNFTIIHFSVNNVLGSEEIYGYHYAKQPSEDGSYKSYQVKAQAKRFFVLAVMITFDKYWSSFN